MTEQVKFWKAYVHQICLPPLFQNKHVLQNCFINVRIIANYNQTWDKKRFLSFVMLWKNILILYKASFPQIVASLKLMLSHISHMTVGQGRYSCSKIFLESFFLRLFIPIFTDIYFLTGLVLKDEFHSLNEYLQWFCPSSELSVLAIKKCIYMIFSYALHPLYSLNRNSN